MCKDIFLYIYIFFFCFLIFHFVAFVLFLVTVILQIDKASCLVYCDLVGITDAFSNILNISDHPIKICGQSRQYNYGTG